MPKERLAEKLLTSGGLGRAGIVGLLRGVEGVCWYWRLPVGRPRIGGRGEDDEQ